MLMNVKPLSRNSPTRAVPKRKSPRMMLFFFAALISAVVAAFNSGEVYISGNLFLVEAHGHAKVVLAEKENVHSGDGCDFVDILDAVGRFDLQSDDPVAVPIASVTKQTVFVHAALRKIDRARSRCWILCAAHGLPRFRRCVDVGDEHAVCAHVQRLLNAAAIVIALYAHQRLCAAICNSREHCGKAFVAHRAVLRVYKQPVVAAVRELLSNGGAVRVEKKAEFRCPGAKFFLEVGSSQSVCHEFFSVREVSWLKAPPYFT